jgi:hypothetical protein
VKPPFFPELSEVESPDELELPLDEPELRPEELALNEAEKEELATLATLLSVGQQLEPREASLARGRNELFAQLEKRNLRVESAKRHSRFGYVLGLLGTGGALALALLILRTTDPERSHDKAPAIGAAHRLDEPATRASEAEPADRERAKGGRKKTDAPSALARAKRGGGAAAPTDPRAALARAQAEVLTAKLTGTPADEASLARAEDDYRAHLLSRLEGAP